MKLTLLFGFADAQRLINYKKKIKFISPFASFSTLSYKLYLNHPIKKLKNKIIKNNTKIINPIDLQLNSHLIALKKFQIENENDIKILKKKLSEEINSIKEPLEIIEQNKNIAPNKKSSLIKKKKNNRIKYKYKFVAGQILSLKYLDRLREVFNCNIGGLNLNKKMINLMSRPYSFKKYFMTYKAKDHSKKFFELMKYVNINSTQAPNMRPSINTQIKSTINNKFKSLKIISFISSSSQSASYNNNNNNNNNNYNNNNYNYNNYNNNKEDLINKYYNSWEEFNKLNLNSSESESNLNYNNFSSFNNIIKQRFGSESLNKYITNQFNSNNLELDLEKKDNEFNNFIFNYSLKISNGVLFNLFSEDITLNNPLIGENSLINKLKNIIKSISIESNKNFLSSNYSKSYNHEISNFSNQRKEIIKSYFLNDLINKLEILNHLNIFKEIKSELVSNYLINKILIKEFKDYEDLKYSSKLKIKLELLPYTYYYYFISSLKLLQFICLNLNNSNSILYKNLTLNEKFKIKTNLEYYLDNPLINRISTHTPDLNLNLFYKVKNYENIISKEIIDFKSYYMLCSSKNSNPKFIINKNKKIKKKLLKLTVKLTNLFKTYNSIDYKNINYLNKFFGDMLFNNFQASKASKFYKKKLNLSFDNSFKGKNWNVLFKDPNFTFFKPSNFKLNNSFNFSKIYNSILTLITSSSIKLNIKRSDLKGKAYNLNNFSKNIPHFSIPTEPNKSTDQSKLSELNTNISSLYNYNNNSSVISSTNLLVNNKPQRSKREIKKDLYDLAINYPIKFNYINKRLIKIRFNSKNFWRFRPYYYKRSILKIRFPILLFFFLRGILKYLIKLNINNQNFFIKKNINNFSSVHSDPLHLMIWNNKIKKDILKILGILISKNFVNYKKIYLYNSNFYSKIRPVLRSKKLFFNLINNYILKIMEGLGIKKNIFNQGEEISITPLLNFNKFIQFNPRIKDSRSMRSAHKWNPYIKYNFKKRNYKLYVDYPNLYSWRHVKTNKPREIQREILNKSYYNINNLFNYRKLTKSINNWNVLLWLRFLKKFKSLKRGANNYIRFRYFLNYSNHAKIYRNFNFFFKLLKKHSKFHYKSFNSRVSYLKFISYALQVLYNKKNNSNNIINYSNNFYKSKKIVQELIPLSLKGRKRGKKNVKRIIKYLRTNNSSNFKPLIPYGNKRFLILLNLYYNYENLLNNNNLIFKNNLKVNLNKDILGYFFNEEKAETNSTNKKDDLNNIININNIINNTPALHFNKEIINNSISPILQNNYNNNNKSEALINIEKIFNTYSNIFWPNYNLEIKKNNSLIKLNDNKEYFYNRNRIFQEKMINIENYIKKNSFSIISNDSIYDIQKFNIQEVNNKLSLRAYGLDYSLSNSNILDSPYSDLTKNKNYLNKIIYIFYIEYIKMKLFHKIKFLQVFLNIKKNIFYSFRAATQYKSLLNFIISNLNSSGTENSGLSLKGINIKNNSSLRDEFNEIYNNFYTLINNKPSLPIKEINPSGEEEVSNNKIKIKILKNKSKIISSLIKYKKQKISYNLGIRNYLNKYNIISNIGKHQSVMFNYIKNVKRINTLDAIDYTGSLVKNNISVLLKNFFYMIGRALISKPLFIFTPNKLIIRLSYFINKRIYFFTENEKNKLYYLLIKNTNTILPVEVYNYIPFWTLLKKKKTFLSLQLLNKNNKLNIVSLFKNEINALTLMLEYFFNCSIQLEITRLNYPFYDSNILSQIIALNGKKFNFERLAIRLFRKFLIRNPNNTKRKINISPLWKKSLTSYLSGIKIRVAGRFYLHKIIPRKTVSATQKGSLARGVVNFVDSARFTNKSKRGSFSITVSISHIF